MNKSKKEILEDLARAARAAAAASHSCECPHKSWDEISDQSRENMLWFAEQAYTIVCSRPIIDYSKAERLHDRFREEWVKRGFVRGGKKGEKTHPDLIDFAHLSPQKKLNLRILIGVAIGFFDHYNYFLHD